MLGPAAHPIRYIDHHTINTELNITNCSQVLSVTLHQKVRLAL